MRQKLALTLKIVSLGSDNNTDLIVKIEKDLKKSIKEVSKKSNKKVMHKKRLTSDKKQHEIF